ncbi:hypothetical protein DP117_12080 [Brasilonema sp. UFV-L1]|uniref:hypothetical protein n=1 Tax=Brasilonema sp. UFV-L1 TaxID=2234130 RepID=UPI00145F13AC|nr:hypothetical protein [Brasilonema sp. UFV-L1]NMG07577.1 hypothetical protein [Brasilonema sp. UFV-L1]
MKNKQLKFRMSERRYNKLQLYALQCDKTMTQLFEEFVDSLPSPEIDKNSTALQSVLPAGKSN